MKEVRTPNPLVIFVVRRDILLMCVGERMQINLTNLKTWVTIKSAKSKVIRHMNVGLEPLGNQDLKVTTTTVRSMDIKPLNVDPSPCGHQTNQKRKKVMDITTIGTTTLHRAITTVKSMDTFLRTA